MHILFDQVRSVLIGRIRQHGVLPIYVMLVSELNRLDLRLFDGYHEWRFAILIDEVQINFTLN